MVAAIGVTKLKAQGPVNPKIILPSKLLLTFQVVHMGNLRKHHNTCIWLGRHVPQDQLRKRADRNDEDKYIDKSNSVTNQPDGCPADNACETYDRNGKIGESRSDVWDFFACVYWNERERWHMGAVAKGMINGGIENKARPLTKT